jgi:nicotinate-nucleotide adenylyltransferase
LGGSFNPPHLAHLALAHTALRELALDELRWLPAGQPWQKPANSLAAAKHRLAMVRLLAAGEPRFVIDAREMQRQGPSYTIDTLLEVRAERPEAVLFLVIGQDQLARLPSWHRWPEVVALSMLAVAARAGEAVLAPQAVQESAPRLVQLAVPSMPHSATAIRAALAQRQDITPLVGPAVAGYIAEHHLYTRSGHA